MASLTAQAKANLSQTAAEVEPEATTTAWLTFAAMVLSLIACIFGGEFAIHAGHHERAMRRTCARAEAGGL
ncbi:MAG TPA: hypothetical protein VJP84_09260 [Steroidobacteraceae bacterium]|jgi:hypothetical protein|nr:hypothetical protein [Steroidobacteraceae bacterium]